MKTWEIYIHRHGENSRWACTKCSKILDNTVLSYRFNKIKAKYSEGFGMYCAECALEILIEEKLIKKKVNFRRI